MTRRKNRAEKTVLLISDYPEFADDGAPLVIVAATGVYPGTPVLQVGTKLIARRMAGPETGMVYAYLNGFTYAIPPENIALDIDNPYGAIRANWWVARKEGYEPSGLESVQTGGRWVDANTLAQYVEDCRLGRLKPGLD